ncbi:unnamed protein product, partial [Ixodes persulcatus]
MFGVYQSVVMHTKYNIQSLFISNLARVEDRTFTIQSRLLTSMFSVSVCSTCCFVFVLNKNLTWRAAERHLTLVLISPFILELMSISKMETLFNGTGSHKKR